MVDNLYQEFCFNNERYFHGMGDAILVGSHSLFISGYFSGRFFSIAYFKVFLTPSNDSVSITHIVTVFLLLLLLLLLLYTLY